VAIGWFTKQHDTEPYIIISSLPEEEN